ncbi:MAG: hypothetical protein K9J16_09740, partial [Melioribacteraceae bacterium]|nr:hypothetical protein [Melioribacteraceae bacterium]MCF8354870.1 hypothetical protein [Melioribacteraceae bacterium]MCF8393908.1 hypothetical protein [Melioribacteraceae bacterium]MCF8419680.1 hypothetical protein [Melioribacteraceae bacterium]
QFTNWGNDNAKLKKLRAVLIAHELGHARGKNNNWLTWNNHTGGHNSGCYQYFDSNNEVENDYCIMSALDRFGFPINTSDANAFWEIQTTTLNFCQGHIQMLLNISWK